MKLLEKAPTNKNIRELGFQEIILNNVRHRLVDPKIPSLFKMTREQFNSHRTYIEYLIDREFRIGSRTKPNITHLSSEEIIKIKQAVKNAVEDYLRNLKK